MRNAIFALAGTLVCAHGQWLNHPTPGTPRTADGRANLSAPAPRVNGKTDFSGVWQIQPIPGEVERTIGPLNAYVVPGDDPATFSKYFFNVLADFKRGEEPFLPEAAAKFKKAMENPGSAAPPLCSPLGIPAANLLGAPFKILQTPGVLIVLYEADNMFRQVYIDGRQLPADPQPSWMGYSVGKWEGDTLVIDTVGFTDRSPLDAFGHPRSESTHIQERFHRTDFGHMAVELTVNDPKNYSKAFTIKFTELLVPDTDILESVCENEKDKAHMPPR